MLFDGRRPTKLFKSLKKSNSSCTWSLSLSARIIRKVMTEEVLKMGFSVSNPTYLYQSTSGYIFRFRIPKDLRVVVGKGESRYSLRSGILRVAKYRARCITSYIHQLFVKVRSSMSEFSKERIDQLVREYSRQTLDDAEKC